MNAPLDTTNRGGKETVTAEELKLTAGELRKLHPERRELILAVHAERAAQEYAANPGWIIEGGNEIIEY